MFFNKAPKLLCAAAALFAGTAAQADVTLRLAHHVSDIHPLVVEGFNPWMESITAASNGTIKFEVYPAQQLGAAKDHYDMVRDGIADIAWVNPGYQPGRFPVIAAAEVPLTMRDADVGSFAFDTWYRQYAEKEMKEVMVCIAHINEPGTLHSKTEVRNVSQLNGMKVRPSNAVVGSYVRTAGAVNVTVAAPESREALEKGTADAITFPTGQLAPYGLNEVVKYHIDLPLYTQTALLAVNKNTIARMTEEERAVMQAHCTPEWSQKIIKGWNDFERAGRVKLEADGHNFVKLTAEEEAGWVDLVKPALEAWKSDVNKAGYDAEEVWNGFQSAMQAADVLMK